MCRVTVISRRGGWAPKITDSTGSFFLISREKKEQQHPPRSTYLTFFIQNTDLGILQVVFFFGKSGQVPVGLLISMELNDSTPLSRNWVMCLFL